MKTVWLKQEMGMAFVVCIAFLSAALGITGMLWVNALPEEEQPLGQRAGFCVFQGAPEGGERWIRISRNTLLQGTLMQVDADHLLPADFPGPNARGVRGMVGSYLPAMEDTALQEEAIYALCDLHLAHSLHHGITFTRGAQSMAQLTEAQNEAFQRYALVYSLDHAVQQAKAACPDGRESEHRLGYVLDVNLHPPLAFGFGSPLKRNEAGRWLSEHMWQFGWIDRTGITACENIHIRYVGKEHGAAMHALDCGLEEYLALLREKGSMTVLYHDRPYAYLYCIPFPETQMEITIALPKEGEIRASADNSGWAIISCILTEDYASVSGREAIH